MAGADLSDDRLHRRTSWARGVEPICKVLPVAPSTYHDHVAKPADPEKLPAQAKRDMALKPEIERVFVASFEVHDSRKVWRRAKPEKIR